MTDERNPVQVDPPEATAFPRIAAHRRPLGPKGEVMSHQRRSRRRTAIDEKTVLAVDAVCRDRHGEVAVRGEHIGDVPVTLIAGHRPPPGQTRPVARTRAGRPSAITGAVPAVQEQHHRPRPARTNRRRHFGEHLERRGIVLDLEARELVAQSLRSIRSRSGGRALGLRELRFVGRRRVANARLGGVDPTSARPDRQLDE